MKHPIDIQSTYHDHLIEINKSKRAALDKIKPKEPYYRPSSAGMCSRKIYYETILRIDPTEVIDKRVQRLFRLGDLIHQDIQDAFKKVERNDFYFSIYNIYINNIYIEKEIVLKTIRVRGFCDLVVELDDGRVYLYDIKSIGAFQYKKNFARNKELREPSIHQELQLATYGLAVKKEFGRLDGILILYYNKDTSMLRYKEVSSDRLLTALGFWERINAEHSKNSLPTLQEFVSPVAKWECSYCSFKSRCEEDTRKGI